MPTHHEDKDDAPRWPTLEEQLKASKVIPGSALEKLIRAAKIDAVYIPFSGTAPAVNALLGEHVTAAMAEYPVVVELVRSGKLRALATGSRQRVTPLTDVPTIAESGYPDYQAAVWVRRPRAGENAA